MRYVNKNIGGPRSGDMTNIVVKLGIMVPTSNDLTRVTNLGITAVHMDRQAQDLCFLGGKSHLITGRTHSIGEMLMDISGQTDGITEGKTRQTIGKIPLLTTRNSLAWVWDTKLNLPITKGLIQA